MLYNEKATLESNSRQFFVDYFDWYKEKGIQVNGVHFAANFGAQGEIRGCLVTKDIGPYQPIIAVPLECTLTLSKAEKDPALMEVFEQFPAIFNPSRTFFANANRFVFYALTEYCKGKDSEYYYILYMCSSVGYGWLDKEVNETIKDKRLKEELLEVKERIQEFWEVVQEIHESFPALFQRPIEYKDFLLCFYQFWSRAYYTNLPSIFLPPGMDNINHDDEENITLASIVNRPLESRSEEECTALGYQKRVEKIDFSPVFEELKDKPIVHNSLPLKFLESVGVGIENPELISTQEELQLANDKGLALLNGHSGLQAWHLPNWIGLRFENDDDPCDLEEMEDSFEGQTRILTEALKYIEQGKQLPPGLNHHQLKVTRIGSNLYSPDYYHPDKFRWYHQAEEKEIYAVLSNRKNKVIKTGQQVFLLYGKNTNRFLLKSYGFAMSKNIYDALAFCYLTEEARIKFGFSDPIYDGYIRPEAGRSVDGVTRADAGVEYRSKRHLFNVELFAEVKRRLLQDPDSAVHGQTVHSKLAAELAALEKYAGLFETYLQSHLRPRSEYLLLKEQHKNDIRYTFIFNCELGQLEIAESQLRFAEICKTILNQLIDCQELTAEKFKEIYMSECKKTADWQNGHTSEKVLAISAYLQQLFNHLQL
jgi:hypothetical protein